MSILRSSKKKHERKRKIVFFSLLFILLIGGIFSFAVWMMSQPVFQIQNIVVQGSEVVNPDNVEQVAKKIISGNYFYFFPRANIFLYPKESVQREILASFPRIKMLSLSLSKERVLVISLVERDPATLWCGVVRPLDTTAAGACYYMDDSGYIFGQAPSFSGHAYFEFYGKGQIFTDDPIGRRFISPELIQKIAEIRGILASENEKVFDVLLADDATGEFTSEHGCLIRFNTDQDISELKPNMEAVFSSHDWGKKISKGNTENLCSQLEYIDFRFGNKIYYKQKSTNTKSIFPSLVSNNLSSSTANATMVTHAR